MSVPKTERKQSKFEVIYNADKLRKSMIFFLLKDLGVKNKVRDIEIIKKRVNFEEDDAKNFYNLCEKYGITQMKEKYPEWYINFSRELLFKYSEEISTLLECANSLYPTTLSDCDNRRNNQNKAIGYCYKLSIVFQDIKEGDLK